MKTPQPPQSNRYDPEWGRFVRAEALLRLAQEHLTKLEAQGWIPLMKAHELHIREDLKLKDADKEKLFSHQERVDRMVFWKAVYQGQVDLAHTRLREAEDHLEHWDTLPTTSIRKQKKTLLKEGLLL